MFELGLHVRCSAGVCSTEITYHHRSEARFLVGAPVALNLARANLCCGSYAKDKQKGMRAEFHWGLLCHGLQLAEL